MFLLSNSNQSFIICFVPCHFSFYTKNNKVIINSSCFYSVFIQAEPVKQATELTNFSYIWSISLDTCFPNSLNIYKDLFSAITFWNSIPVVSTNIFIWAISIRGNKKISKKRIIMKLFWDFLIVLFAFPHKLLIQVNYCQIEMIFF